jgi:hypothetical protein
MTHSALLARCLSPDKGGICIAYDVVNPTIKDTEFGQKSVVKTMPQLGVQYWVYRIENQKNPTPGRRMASAV